MLRVHIFRCKMKTTNWKQSGPFPLKAHSRWWTSSIKTAPHKPSQTAPPAGDQLFKWQRHGGHTLTQVTTWPSQSPPPHCSTASPNCWGLRSQTHKRLGNIPPSSHSTFCHPIWPATCWAVSTSKEGLSD